MVIVTGDHGMKDSGGHGGVTFSEVTVPLISVGNPCRHLPGYVVPCMLTFLSIKFFIMRFIIIL